MKQALKCDFTWADFKTNSDGMVPVVGQDAENDEVLIDCDNDTILAKVEQVGAACHTGNRTCFYRTLAE